MIPRQEQEEVFNEVPKARASWQVLLETSNWFLQCVTKNQRFGGNAHCRFVQSERHRIKCSPRIVSFPLKGHHWLILLSVDLHEACDKLTLQGWDVNIP